MQDVGMKALLQHAFLLVVEQALASRTTLRQALSSVVLE
jgi:hypothetical protein